MDLVPNGIRRGAPTSRAALAAVLFLGQGLVACDRADQPDFMSVEPPPVPGPAVHLRPGSMTADVDLTVGQTLAVELETHFDWREEAAPALLRLVDMLSGPANRATRDLGVTGGQYWKVFVYRAETPGEETLQWIEAREWDPETVTNRYTLTVRVTSQVDESQAPAA